MREKLITLGTPLVQILILVIAGMYLSFETTMLISFVSLLVFCALSYFILGEKWQKKKQLRESYRIIFLTMILYYLIYYFTATMTGFSFIGESTFGGTILFLGNILALEFLRNGLLQEQNRNINLFVTLVCSILLGIYGFTYFSIDTSFLSMSAVIIGSIFTNIFLSYVSYKIGRVPAMLYQSLFFIPLFIAPICPALPTWLWSVILLILPMIMLGQIYSLVEKKKDAKKIRRVRDRDLLFVPLVVFLLLILGLSTGIFKFQMYAIASNSMKPEFSKGDAVVFEHIEKEEFKTIQINDILVYQGDDRIIVHRVTKKEYQDGKYTFQTKGDNNEEVDLKWVQESQVIGVVRAHIPFIGYPTIWFHNVTGKAEA